MKNINKLFIGLGILAMSACSDFEEINIDPHAANKDQVNPEYAFNKSIYEAQQDPYYGERVFVLTWKGLARQNRYNGNAALGGSVDEWEGAIFSASSSWQNYAKTGMDLADYRMTLVTTTDDQKIFYPNMKEAARIWKAYLLSGILDQFGTAPLNAFEGVNPNYGSEKEGYYYVLGELETAVNFLKTSKRVNMGDGVNKYDIAYNFDFDKWIKFGNSIRMRLAMRLSEVDPEKAQSVFEDAVKGGYISNLEEVFSVQEKDAWNALAGVMSRTWNRQPISPTINNLLVGLGGIESKAQLKDRLHAYIKPADYLGERYEKHYTLHTNDPMAGFWFDGLRNKIDPRAYKLFHIPQDWENPDYNTYPEGDPSRTESVKKLLAEDGTTVVKEIDAKFTWNAMTLGNLGDIGARNQLTTSAGELAGIPLMVKKFRDSTNKRVFFGSWESYFLIAEAALRGWTVPMSAKDAYEAGIGESFKYHGVESFLADYLKSQDYNNVGTSASWDHTAEPPATVKMKIRDGYTGKEMEYDYAYPVAENTLYGKALNDQSTKIITQKYIANMPWDPLESWCDQRRLGLPFFETPAVENPIANLPAITKANVKGKQKIEFFPQRSKFPSVFKNNNPAGYETAVNHLSTKEDTPLTPLWWAKQK